MPWASREPDRPWDHIVVGAGSAGSVLANRLSSDGTTRVLVLEAGGGDLSPFIQIPAAMVKLPKKYDWSYPGEPDPSRHGATDTWAAGKVVGGSSSINGMVWVRGNRGDYDHWESLGCTGWGYESVLPYFRRSERYERGPSPYRGSDGPQRVAHARTRHVLTDLFVEAAQHAGIPFNDDFNSGHQDGVSYIQLTQRRGLRHSTARAYLAPARRRRNVSVRTGSFVTRVIVENGRACGVEYRHRGRLRRADCSGEVILSAGTFASPKILMLSGIGPAAALSSLGIDVVADLPGVGKNLQEHLWTPLQYEVDINTLNQEATPLRVFKHGLELLLHGTGPATSSVGTALVFDRLSADSPVPDFQAMFGPFAMTQGSESEGGSTGAADPSHDIGKATIRPMSAVTSLPCVLHPYGRGSVTLRSANPADPPRISYALAGDVRDVNRLVAICRRIRTIYETSPMREHVVREVLPGPSVDTDDQWRAHIHAASFGGAHASGTCKMGVDDGAVVDPALSVHGVAGLRVVDASVMPTIPSGNTNAPVIMIGERASDLISPSTSSH